MYKFHVCVKPKLKEKREIVRKKDLEGRKKYVKEERKKEREIQKKGKRMKKLRKARVTKDGKRKRERSQGKEKVKEGKVRISIMASTNYT